MSADSVLSAFMQVVLERAFIAARQELGLILGVSKELNKLSRTLDTIRAVLEDAEEKQIRNAAVRDWLRHLKDIAYEADDLLDAFNFRALRRKVEGGERTWQGFRVFSSCFGLRHALFRSRMAHQIMEIRKKLDEMAKERDNLQLRELTDGTSRTESLRRPPTSSLVDESNVLGREEDRDEIVRFLVSQESRSRNLPVLPIVGFGGLGKTTLAQIVYNDARVTNHFDLKMWVFVSCNYNVVRLTKSMVEAATKKKSDLTDLNMLQETLVEELRGKRFLLILDDVWNEVRANWDRTRLPLNAGRSGSKVVLTTRIKRVAQIMGTVPPYHLKRLSKDACWTLFSRSAFAGGEFAGNHKLQAIGKEIVSKLDGIPLAAKTIGSMLFARPDEVDWRKILKSEFWELPANENDILPPLKLSYQTLPSHLKQCFSYCSIFQKGYEFDKDKLVKIWMGQGFLQHQGTKQMEDTGAEYFDELLGRSLFQNSKDGYVMHDMIQALAQYVSVDECFIAQDCRLQGIPGKVRHLSLTSEDSLPIPLEALFGFRSLRTLVTLHGFNSSVIQIPPDLFLHLKYLRVLDFSDSFLEELPETIGNLVHLRYLDLTATAIARLPESISKLYSLQTLRLRECFSLKGLPKGITNLINLRHLEEDSRLISSVAGIGKLTCLQELPIFKIHQQIGHRISELKDMTEIRGSLCILNLENVADAEEARQARSSYKQHLQKLQLEWNAHSAGSFRDEDILECLQPHESLKELHIEGYNGSRFPSWVGDPVFSSLTKMYLHYCNCSLLPPLGRLRFLTHLEMQGLDGIKHLGPEFCGHGRDGGFPSLEVLQLEDMTDWLEWSGVTETHFPCLRELSIVRCPKLRRLPAIASLSSVHISNCSDLQSLPADLTRLRRLEIYHCENMVVPSEGSGLLSLASLKHLDVENCPKLMSVAEAEAVHLPKSLQVLRINSCTDPSSWVFKEIRFLTSLQYLQISECMNLKVLPEGLRALPSLHSFLVLRCPQITALPEDGLPATLQCMSVESCPMLHERCKEERGLDWHKINRIPTVVIDGQHL